MTGYESKRAAARDKLEALAQPAQQLTLQEQLDRAKAAWDKAEADRDKADADLRKAYEAWDKAGADRDRAGADWGKAGAELRRIKKLMEQQDA